LLLRWINQVSKALGGLLDGSSASICVFLAATSSRLRLRFIAVKGGIIQQLRRTEDTHIISSIHH